MDTLACSHVKKRVVFLLNAYGRKKSPPCRRWRLRDTATFCGSNGCADAGKPNKFVLFRQRQRHCSRKNRQRFDLKFYSGVPPPHPGPHPGGIGAEYGVPLDGQAVRQACFLTKPANAANRHGWFAGGIWRFVGFSVIGLKSKFLDVRSCRGISSIAKILFSALK